MVAGGDEPIDGVSAARARRRRSEVWAMLRLRAYRGLRAKGNRARRGFSLREDAEGLKTSAGGMLEVARIFEKNP